MYKGAQYQLSVDYGGIGESIEDVSVVTEQQKPRYLSEIATPGKRIVYLGSVRAGAVEPSLKPFLVSWFQPPERHRVAVEPELRELRVQNKALGSQLEEMKAEHDKVCGQLQSLLAEHNQLVADLSSRAETLTQELEATRKIAVFPDDLAFQESLKRAEAISREDALLVLLELHRNDLLSFTQLSKRVKRPNELFKHLVALFTSELLKPKRLAFSITKHGRAILRRLDLI